MCTQRDGEINLRANYEADRPKLGNPEYMDTIYVNKFV